MTEKAVDYDVTGMISLASIHATHLAYCPTFADVLGQSHNTNEVGSVFGRVSEGSSSCLVSTPVIHNDDLVGKAPIRLWTVVMTVRAGTSNQWFKLLQRAGTNAEHVRVFLSSVGEIIHRFSEHNWHAFLFIVGRRNQRHR